MRSSGLRELLDAPSHWQAQRTCRPVHAGPLPFESDIVVIGAGLSGLAAAQRALELGFSVTVLDAGEVGGGASGRNSGFVVPIPTRHTPDSLRFLLGENTAPFMAALQHTVARLLESAGPQEPVRGWVQPFAQAPATNVNTLLAGWKALGVAVELLTGDSLNAALGTSRYANGLHFAGGGALDPLAVVQQLADAIDSQGGVIIEHCRATRVQPHAGWVAVDTPAGRIKAGRVFIAGNAYGVGASRSTRRAVGPLALTLATFKVASESAAGPLPFSDNARDMWFARRLDASSVLTGCFALPWQCSANACAALLQSRIESLYGRRPAAPERQWAGWVGLTTDAMPTIHHNDARVVSWSGCNGRGIALSVLMGRTLLERLFGLAGPPLTLSTGTPWQPRSALAWLAQMVIARDRRRQRGALFAS